MGIQLLLCLLALAIHREIQVQACNEEYISPNGSISSPLYPKEYPNNQDCIYTINATEGHRITLEFSTSKLQAGISGCKDFLQIRDGNSENSPSLGIFCNKSVPERVRSTSNTMWIRFHSNSSKPGGSFEATYTTAIIPQKFLLVTGSGPSAIYRIDIDTGSNFSIPIPGLVYPSGMDYDAVDGRIYWADLTEKMIRSANLDGSDVQLVHNLSEGAVPLAVSVDSLSRLIFYTDAGNNFICMITMYNKRLHIVLALSPDSPRDIELDKHRGVMYYSVWGDTPKIAQANYDGSDRKTLVSGPEYLYSPTGLALDTSSDRLYWTDAWTEKIRWTDLKSNTTEVIFNDRTRENDYIGMDIYQSELFIADWGIDSIRATTSYIHRISTDGRNWTNITAKGRMQKIRVYVEETEDKVKFQGPTDVAPTMVAVVTSAYPFQRTEVNVCPEHVRKDRHSLRIGLMPLSKDSWEEFYLLYPPSPLDGQYMESKRLEKIYNKVSRGNRIHVKLIHRTEDPLTFSGFLLHSESHGQIVEMSATAAKI